MLHLTRQTYALALAIALAANATTAGAWTAGKKVINRETHCMMEHDDGDGTLLSFILTQDLYDGDAVGVAAANPDWPKFETDHRQIAMLLTSDGRLEAPIPDTIPNGFILFLPRESIPPFLNDARQSGFILRVGENALGIYTAEGMSLAYGVLLECGRAEFASKDPFAP